LATRSAVVKIVLALLGVAPGIFVSLTHPDISPFWGLAIFGLAIWCAATLLGWAAETAEMDITGAFAMALLAIVAILPEYAVDVLLAFTAGTDPTYEALASANMNGATRLLIGLALPLVVLVGIRSRRVRARKQAQDAADAAGPGDAPLEPPAPRRSAFFDVLPIPAAHYSVMFFLVIAAGLGIVAPLTRQVHAGLGAVLIVVFVVFLWHTSRGDVGEPDLVGVSAFLGARAKVPRRIIVIAFFLIAAATIAIGAEPFVDSLVESGRELHINEALLIQWLAPLASEAPEFIIALTLASRNKAWAAVGMLLTSMVNQWAALVGSLPFAFKLGGGSWALPLDGRQVEEFLLTGSVTAVAVTLLLSLRIPAWGAWFMLAVFAAEFALPSEHARLILAAVNAAAALILLLAHARKVPALLKEPFRRSDAG
jgi:cation:H+ antiporter